MRFTNLRKMSWTSLSLALLLAGAFCSAEKNKIPPGGTRSSIPTSLNPRED